MVSNIINNSGTCLVCFGIWYGVNYFKDDEKPSPEIPVEEPNFQNPNEENNTPSYPLGEKIDFPQKSDEDAILLNVFFELLSVDEIKTNFNNLKKEKQ